MAALDLLLAGFPATKAIVTAAQLANVAPSSVPQLDTTSDIQRAVVEGKSKAADLQKELVDKRDAIPGLLLEAVTPDPPSVPAVPPLLKIAGGLGLIAAGFAWKTGRLMRRRRRRRR